MVGVGLGVEVGIDGGEVGGVFLFEFVAGVAHSFDDDVEGVFADEAEGAGEFGGFWQ